MHEKNRVADCHFFYRNGFNVHEHIGAIFPKRFLAAGRRLYKNFLNLRYIAYRLYISVGTLDSNKKETLIVKIE
ncbi:hypothetical protein PUR_43440 [Paenibacillus sp. URB8-2]|nr:hypothetical protein PUR_43440 [Paenibacillus sp. URB8-2]